MTVKVLLQLKELKCLSENELLPKVSVCMKNHGIIIMAYCASVDDENGRFPDEFWQNCTTF